MSREIDAGRVIGALQRQVADLAYRLALAEAQIPDDEEQPDDDS